MSKGREHKQHLPKAGEATGLQGPSLCGRWATYRTGDHSLLYQLARTEGEREHWCRECLKRARQD